MVILIFLGFLELASGKKSCGGGIKSLLIQSVEVPGRKVERGSGFDD